MPTLFDTTWDDREIYRSGLIVSEQDVLEGLTGATIYHMRLQIDDSLTIVRGQQEIRFTNREVVNLNDLFFHLFPNLLGGTLTVSGVRVDGLAGTPQLQTGGSIMRVPLPESLAPGEQSTIYMEFTTEIPSEAAVNHGIFAYVDHILAMAHFYPMIAVFDDEGWNVAPPVAGGDIVYSEASFYLVEVAAPDGLVMAGSGIAQSGRQTGEGILVTYAAGPMRDFYLAASDRYQLMSLRSGETVVNSFAPEQYGAASEIILEAATAALISFSDRFGPYPYTELDVVATPLLALGVEYPGIFANAIRLYEIDNPEDGSLFHILLESTTAHEVGHQWFYGLIGNDQLDEPWLDESLTQYLTWLYYVDRYGPANAQGFYQSLLDRWKRVDNAAIPIGMPVSFYEGSEYGAIVYGRGPIFIMELAQTLGQEEFDKFLREYYFTFQWGVATSQGFMQLAESYCDCDLTELFNSWVYSE